MMNLKQIIHRNITILLLKLKAHSHKSLPTMKKTLLLVFTNLLFFNLINAQLSNLNDEFENSSTLSNWQNTSFTEGWNVEHLEELNIDSTQAGRLVMMPYTTGWFEDRRAPLIYKEVTGDFIATTEVHVSNRAGNGIPSSYYSLAGPMIRTPRDFPNGPAIDWTPGNENYIFLSTGYGDENGPGQPGPPPHIEVKTTVNSNSTLHISQVNSQSLTIRLARIANAIILLYQEPGGSWVVHRRFDRPDFPATVQAGMMSYTDWSKVSTFNPYYQNSNLLTAATADPDSSSNPSLPYNPDLLAGFEYFRFDSVEVPVGLQGVDLVNTATDAELLSFLGFPSLPLAQTKAVPVDIRVYPNPAETHIEVSVPAKFRGKLTLRDLQGCSLKQLPMHGPRMVNLSRFASGIYLIEVQGANGELVHSQKVIKK